MSSPWGDATTTVLNPLARFLLIGSAVTVLLAIAPVIAFVLISPTDPPWASFGVWGLTMLLAWSILFTLRLRRALGL